MSDLEFDFSQVIAFAKNFESNTENDFLESACDSVGNALLNSLKVLTPVGQYKGAKQGGTLRSGWNYEGVQRQGNDFVITALNPTEYASYVNNGHRTRGGKGWVEGQFFCEKALDEAADSMNGVVNEAVKSYLSRLGFD